MSKTSEGPLPAALVPVYYTSPNTPNRTRVGFVALLVISCWYWLGAIEKYIHNEGTVKKEWKDDVWPIRQPSSAEHWDISVDFPYPRTLNYTVTEGTWLRLDVHPQTGEIVFDMLGDLYCLPASAYMSETSSGEHTRARPILRGIPHDSDPHISPDGTKLLFKSDAELGVDNIWIMDWKGCDAMDLGTPSTSISEELSQAQNLKQYEENLLLSGVKESYERRRHRLTREGRIEALRVTNETYRTFTDARFHPSGNKIIATKWYTSERSLGAGEGWEYTFSNSHQNKHHSIEAGSGKKLVGRTLPAGWEPEQYGDQQIGPEQFIWRGEDSVIYSKNVIDEPTGQFTYSKDVHSGIYAIFSQNLTSRVTETLVSSFPGGASRPELSRDGRTLAFVRRVRDKEALVLKDLKTGTLHHVWHGLTYDLTTVSAPMGTYPSFAFTPSDDAVIIWAAGEIWRVPISLNKHGERVAAHHCDPVPIKFQAHVEKRLAETRRSETDILRIETADSQRVYAFKEMSLDETASTAIFQGAGATYVQHLKSGETQKVPILKPDHPYYSPSFVPWMNGNMAIHARWSDVDFSTFEIATLSPPQAWEVNMEEAGMGRYYSPIVCECEGSERVVAWIRNAGDILTGDVVATAGAGLYIGKITLPTFNATIQKVKLHSIQFISSKIQVDDLIHMRFMEKNAKLLIQQSRKAFIIDLSTGPNEHGHHRKITLANGKMSTELAVAPIRVKKGTYKAESVAFVDFFHVYLASGKRPNEEVWSKPGSATKGLARLSLDGGHDIVFSRDGKSLFWLLGPYLHSLEVSKLSECATQVKQDTSTFGIDCVKTLLEYQTINVHHLTSIQRLQLDTHISSDINSDALVILNATILTMESGNVHSDLIPEGTLISRAGVIEYVGDAHTAIIPIGATIMDAQGGYVLPGFIDAHAHWDVDNRYPAASWELATMLAYGITSLHNPSADNVNAFVERSRVERGQMIGPRIFSVGTIIYGAGGEGFHQDIVDMAEARSALIRIKAEGGPTSFSYKNYNIPSRAARQRLLLAARNLSMLCVPEGGMQFDWDLTYILDGMTTIEHAIPVPVLYDDVLTLYALSGTGATPTHLVNYGGAWGEQFVWAHSELSNDPKLRRFTRHDILEALTESTARPHDSWAFFNTSASVAKLVDRGLLAHIGAHGEPPLGLNYHAELHFTALGGLDNYEVLKAATISAATTLGIVSSVGSLTPGKLADFLIYPPGIDLLSDNIKKTQELLHVVRSGRVWDASTLEEVWPVKGRIQQMPPINAE